MAKFLLVKQIFSLELLMLTSVYWTLFQQCNANASWNNFALCPGCTGKRLVVPGNGFQPRVIGKGSSLIWVRMDCSHSCANQDSCYAFNFYENESFYFCELLSDNFHRNKTALELLSHPGCFVWEKLSTSMNSLISAKSTQPTPGASTAMTQPSTATAPKPSTRTTSTSTKMTASLSTGVTLSTTYPTSQPCADVRPGCLGTYPECHSCIKTCVDYMARDDLIDPQVYLWPDGDGLDSVPIRAKCQRESIILLERNINLTSGTENKNYIMSFYDMHRLCRLNVYPYLITNFGIKDKPNVSTGAQTVLSSYKDFTISPNGTLSNLTYMSSPVVTLDIFNLNGKPMNSTPFINVTDDRYSCGSFWLLDATNATYCPGGATGMFGTLRTNATGVVNTGIRVPKKVNGTVYSVYAVLAVYTIA